MVAAQTQEIGKHNLNVQLPADKQHVNLVAGIVMTPFGREIIFIAVKMSSLRV